MFQGGLIHAGGSDRTEFVYRAVCNGQAGASTSVPEGLIASSHLTRAQQNVLAWDGRLDNADELRNALAGSDYIHTEQELVLQLYLKFGLKSIGLLIGDFALSIWDQQRNTLLLARDAFGARPLYYRHHGREIVWASDLDVLVGWAGNVSAIDDEYIADYLTVPVRSDLTPYRGLRAVPPATSLVYSAATGTIELHEFWSPVSCAPVVYDSDLEYENHFLRVFEDAVRCRLRASGPVWIELSGGLDSSSIVCVAERLRHREKADLADYRTVSDVFPESKSSDETEYIKEVERSIGREGTYLQENDQRILDPIDEWVSLPGPLLAFGRRHLTLSAAMHALGSNILVKGVGGDQVLWSNWQACFDVADLFWTGRVGAFLKRIRDWR